MSAAATRAATRGLHVGGSPAWPALDVTAYDRGPLRPEERVALAALRAAGGYRRLRGAPARALHAQLARLIAPLDAAARVVGLRPPVRAGRLHGLVLEGMARTDLAFWAWSDAAWATAIHRVPGLGALDPPGADAAADVAADAVARIVQARAPCCAAAYLLCDRRPWSVRVPGGPREVPLVAVARVAFGRAHFDAVARRVTDALAGIGYARRPRPRRDRPTRTPSVSGGLASTSVATALAAVLLDARTPHLEGLTLARVEALRDAPELTPSVRASLMALSQALHALGLWPAPLRPWHRGGRVEPSARLRAGIAPAWVALADRWLATTTVAPRTRDGWHGLMLRAGRWLAATHPDVCTADAWTTEIAAAYVAAVDRGRVGEYAARITGLAPGTLGQPLRPRTKDAMLTAVRILLTDARRWKWARLPHVEPSADLATPPAIARLIAPDPRDIATPVWLKLVWASLNVSDADVRAAGLRAHPALVRALAVLWTHGGLRSDEATRLAVGCVRDVPPDGWTPADVEALGELTASDVARLVCFLDVPHHKTGGPMPKPVGRCVGEALRAWERVRPAQPLAVDAKTGARVAFLFSERGRRVRRSYFNEILIPFLCARAGVPTSDVPGKPITSHRGRASISSWYFNTHAGMTLQDVSEWLGHRSLDATRAYTRRNPLVQATRFARVHQHSALAEVFLDPARVWPAGPDAPGAGALAGKPRVLYALGNDDYCANPFYATCPHRVVCPGCDFHVPAGSQEATALQAKGAYVRLLMEMPLNADERAAVAGDLAKQATLVGKLQRTPTPSGPTPEELAARPGRRLPVLTAPREPPVASTERR